MTWQQINLIDDTNNLFMFVENKSGNKTLQRSDGWKAPETGKQALELSIAKWEHIVRSLQNGIVIWAEGSTNTCGLCSIYYLNVEYDVEYDSDKYCSGCPVSEKTGLDVCQNTPYEDFSNALNGGYESSVIIAAAQAELDFLISLRENPE